MGGPERESEADAVDRESFVQAFCDRLNACQHPRKVCDALWLLAKMRVQDAENMTEEGEVLLRNLPAFLQETQSHQ